MPSPSNTDPPVITDFAPAGRSADPWAAVAELRTQAALTAAVADALARAHSLREAVHGCADALVHCLDAAFARIWTLNERDNVLELQASAGLYVHLDGPHGRVPVGKFKIGLIAQERRPHFTNSVIGDPRVSDQEWARREGMVAFVGYPLLLVGQVVGVMALFARQPLTPTTLQALAAVADAIAHGIDHWRIVEALRASEERFALAIRGTAEGIWDWNVLTNEVYLAPRFKELLGYEEHELQATYSEWESRLHLDDRDRTLQALQKHLEERHRFQVDYRLRTKSGNYRWFQARGQALWDVGGRPVRMLGSIRDVTARKLAEARLAAAQRVTRILAESAELTDVLPCILRSLCESMGWGVGEYWLRGPKDDVLRLAAFYHLPAVPVPAFEADSHHRTFARGAGLPGRAWEAARLLWVEDVTQDDDFLRAAAVRDDLHGAVAFPIRILGEVRGVLAFFNSHILKPDEEMLQALSRWPKERAYHERSASRASRLR